MVFWRQNRITFIFIKIMSHDLLVQMAYKRFWSCQWFQLCFRALHQLHFLHLAPTVCSLGLCTFNSCIWRQRHLFRRFVLLATHSHSWTQRLLHVFRVVESVQDLGNRGVTTRGLTTGGLTTIKVFLQPGSLTTRGSYNQGCYNRCSYNQGCLEPGVLTTRGLTTRGLTSRGSWNLIFSKFV